MNPEILGMGAPSESCTDKKCPFHGGIVVKKEKFVGKIIRKDINKSATMEWHVSHYLPKYERYEIRRRRLRVHNPPCIDAQIGDEVLVARTKPLSKTKHYVVIHKKSGKEKNNAPLPSKKPTSKNIGETKGVKK